jgi:hypothetical protein
MLYRTQSGAFAFFRVLPLFDPKPTCIDVH